MTILKINKSEKSVGLPKISDLEYGTFVTDVPNGQGCVYVKVKKKTINQKKEYGTFPVNVSPKFGMQWESGHSILLNLSYGTLKQIPGNTKVTPLDPELNVSKLPPECFDQVKKS